MKNQLDPFEILLSQYRKRRIEISQELEALNCSVTQTSLIVNAIKDHSGKTLAKLEEELNSEKDIKECLDDLKESFQDLNAFILEQPLRIDRGIIEYKAVEREIIGFENAIRQIQNEYLIEVLDDVDKKNKKTLKKNNDMRKPGSRPSSLKSTRQSKKSNS